jgi:hypothetical protein
MPYPMCQLPIFQYESGYAARSAGYVTRRRKRRLLAFFTIPRIWNKSCSKEASGKRIYIPLNSAV